MSETSLMLKGLDSLNNFMSNICTRH